MVDVGVKTGAAWVCSAPGRGLADVLHPVHMGSEDDVCANEDELYQSQKDETNRFSPVLLQQTQEDSPCVLSLHCSLSSDAIVRLLVISEARTMELYDQAGDYCGTVRGQKDSSVHTDGGDRGPFHRKQLVLDRPSSACEVKLLSLDGRTNVAICRIIVGLQQLKQCPLRSPGIDMQAVQSLMEEMGTSLSPGAQNLMEMVHIQQKNQNSSLAGFLPLLMGGGAAFSALTTAVARNQNQSAEFSPPEFSPGDETSSNENRDMSRSSASSSTSSSRSVTLSDVHTDITDNSSPISHVQLSEMMSHFLKGNQGGGVGPGMDILPVLQNVCGQVTQLRLDQAAAAAEREKNLSNASWDLDSVMERRLEEMERRLKEHMDRRLDALEEKLERALLNALPLISINTTGVGGDTPVTTPSPAHDVTNR